MRDGLDKPAILAEERREDEEREAEEIRLEPVFPFTSRIPSFAFLGFPAEIPPPLEE